LKKKKKVALVLSSGGARGLSHIGVIEGLEAHGYEITSISGSSMGALIGGFYACGKLQDYKKWAINLERLDVFKLIDFTFSVQGFIKGEKVFKALREVVPDCDIEDMRIPFNAIATDIHTKKEVVLDKGSMYDAIKASVAIPTVVTPVKRGDAKLIDGGVTNPVPVRHVLRNNGDILVVSNANSSIPYTHPEKNDEKAKEAQQSYMQQINSFKKAWSKLLPGSSTPSEKLGYFELLNRSIDLMQDKMTDLILEHYKPEISVSISRDAASTFEFYKAKELIDSGRKAIEQNIKKYEEKESVTDH